MSVVITAGFLRWLAWWTRGTKANAIVPYLLGASCIALLLQEEAKADEAEREAALEVAAQREAQIEQLQV